MTLVQPRTVRIPSEAAGLIHGMTPFPALFASQKDAHVSVAKTVLRYLPRGARVLDFGSGMCTKTAMLQILGYQCVAYDDLQDHWHQTEPYHTQVMDFIGASGVDFHLATSMELPFEPETFDLVMNHDVLEHLHDSPRVLLNDLVALIRPGGIFYTTVPNAANIRKRIDLVRGRTNLPRFDQYYWSPYPWRGHVREYVRGDLLKLVEYLKLELLDLHGVDQFLQHRLPARYHRLYRAITDRIDGWKDTWSLVARKPATWQRTDRDPKPLYASIYDSHLYPGGNRNCPIPN